MSLKTTPYKPANVEDEPLYQTMNFLEPVTLVYADGSSAQMPLHKAVLLVALYIRRGSPVAVQQQVNGKRFLVLEHGPSGLRATPELLEVLGAIRDLVDAELADASKKAAQRASIEQAQNDEYAEAQYSGTEGGQSSAEYGDESAGSQPESDEQSDSRPAGGRFRRGRR